MSSRQRTHIDDYPEILREQALLGELPPERQAELEASEGWTAFKAERLAENDAIVARHPWPGTRRPSVRLRLVRAAAWAAPLAACLAIVILVAGPPAADDAGVRVKGSGPALSGLAQPSLEIWRRSGDQAAPLVSGGRVQAFDKLQIAYHAMGYRYGVIVSMDGGGRLTLHYPESFDASTELGQGPGQVLPYAYQLDAAPYFERFFFVVSDQPFPASRIWSLIGQQLGGKDTPANWAMSAALNLDPGFQYCSFLLRK